MRRLLKLWLPPILLKLYRSLNISGNRFLGEYSSWEEASKKQKDMTVKVYLRKLSNLP